MNALAFLQSKRDGDAHDEASLRAFVHGVAHGEVPDYQVAAWLMAVCWHGLNEAETAVLTQAMADSGDHQDLSGLQHTIDKHSTGGVGDKTTLVLAPLLAEHGATVAKMSGRGLGHTGGTIDKLESYPGYRAELSDEAFMRQAREVGVVVTGQSKDFAPADGVLYALRDATATVREPSLIASSVMSKKLAGGARTLVLDVKVGRGAFMRTLDEARALGRMMRAIGDRAGREVRVVLSDMSQPLGRTIGNALEVREALDALDGGGPADLRELVLTLASAGLSAAGLNGERAALARSLDDGRARARFERWVTAQGGDPSHPDALALAPGEAVVEAPNDGQVAVLDALAVGRAVKLLGGGRTHKAQDIDRGVGVELHAKVGDAVARDAPLATLRHRDGRGLEEARRLVQGAFEIATHASPPPLVLEAPT
ncbi:MAG: thymidine phosphorylase [Trueperaceae bacterium]|nr:thymidine phosphorylase [Trueperaceae bacterium]